jgi:hypothetical protein
MEHTLLISDEYARVLKCFVLVTHIPPPPETVQHVFGVLERLAARET